MWPMQLFFFMLSMMGLSFMLMSSSWVGVWMGMELNIFGFIPLMSSMKKSLTIEASMKYFLVQAIGSVLFMGATLISLWPNSLINQNNTFMIYMFLLLSFSLKLGLAPLYFWLPSVMSNISWTSCLLLNTMQKIGPLFLFNKFFSLNNITMIMIASSSLIGGTMGMFQSQIRSLMAYSSLVHLSWILLVGCFNFYIMVQYITIYFILSSLIFMYCQFSDFSRKSLSNLKGVILILSFLSLGGLPPLSGFYMKWVGLLTFMNYHQWLSLFLIFGSMFSLYYYLCLIFSWMVTKKEIKKMNLTDLVMITINSTGLLFMIYAMIFFYKS